VPLITTGKPFIRDLEQAGALGVYAPLEGGYEGRYQRRLRATGYESMRLSARGLGDLSTYLAHLLPASKGLVLWLVDGQVLSSQELAYLAELPTIDPRIKVIVELGGDRQFRWVQLASLT
jgi:NAD(P)H-quinone oxidoreductase subunit N